VNITKLPGLVTRRVVTEEYASDEVQDMVTAKPPAKWKIRRLCLRPPYVPPNPISFTAVRRTRSRNRRNGKHDFRHRNEREVVMTVSEYLAATALIALIVWAVLGLLMQES
jgi:hypothetical protein